MTKTKKFIIGTLLSVVTLGGLTAIAGPGHHGKFGGMNAEKAEFIVNRISQKLELNEVQIQNLNTLKDTMLSLKAERKERNPELIKAMLADPILDEATVLHMIQERSNRINQKAPQVVTALANFTNSLNEEQRAQVIKGVDKFSKRRGGRFRKSSSQGQ